MFIFKNKFDENLKEILAIQEVFTDFLIDNYDKMEVEEIKNTELKIAYDRVSSYIIMEQKTLTKFLNIKNTIFIFFYLLQFTSLILGMIYLDFLNYMILLMISMLFELLIEFIFIKIYNSLEYNFVEILKKTFGNCPIKENNIYDIKKDFYLILEYLKEKN